MSKIKLSVELLDNNAKSAVINVGKNSGYVEAFIDDGKLMLSVFDRDGDVIHERAFYIRTLEAKTGGWTATQFPPSKEHYEGDAS
jgi:hypothetical protein